jgi:hypothetical protein
VLSLRYDLKRTQTVSWLSNMRFNVRAILRIKFLLINDINITYNKIILIINTVIIKLFYLCAFYIKN